MAYPQVGATNHSIETDDTTSHTVSLPANIQAGETLLVFFATDGDTYDEISFPAGWTVIERENEPSVTVAVAWRKADGNEGASITVTTGAVSERSAHISYRISGATDPTVTPPEVSGGVSGSDANPNPDSLTPTGGSKGYLWIAVAACDGLRTFTGYPTNYSNGETYQAPDGGSAWGCSVAVARRELTADSEDPGTFTISFTEGWVACTVAVYPAAGATYELSCSDGLAAGDSDSLFLTMNPVVTDGVAGGDSNASKATFYNTLTDGVNGGDAPSTIATFYNTLSDGIIQGETLNIFLTIDKMLADGANLGDAILHLYEANPTLTDGLIQGDSPVSLLHFYNTLTDGLSQGDSPTIEKILNPTISDGLALSESLSTNLIFAVVLTDGIRLSEVTLSEIHRIHSSYFRGGARPVSWPDTDSSSYEHPIERMRRIRRGR